MKVDAILRIYIKVLICQVGGLDCTRKFRKILTPLGVCLDLKLHQDPEFQKDPIALSKSVLGTGLSRWGQLVQKEREATS